MNSMFRRRTWSLTNAMARIALLSGLTSAFLVGSGLAQSPPLGPPEIKVDKYDVSAGVLTGIVQHQIQTTLDTTNSNLQSQGLGARVSALPIQFWSPYRLPTQYMNRPNEWYVKLPVIVGIQVHIPNWFDRQVYVPLDLNVSCAGWEKGSGVIQVDAVPGPPSFEGGSWVEDAPGLSLIRDAVNNAVRSNFGVGAATSTALALDKCIALGVLPGQTANDKFGAILFDRPPNAPAGHPIHGTALQPSLSVTFVSLKRLSAHDVHGNVLYLPAENIILDTYVDFTHQQSPVLTMHEGDQVNLNLPPASFKGPFLDPLVIIANIDQQTNYIEDSAFAAWPRTGNFSPGAHTLTITKRYTLPPGSHPGQTKPEIITVPAYELSYNVNYQGIPVLQPLHPLHP